MKLFGVKHNVQAPRTIVTARHAAKQIVTFSSALLNADMCVNRRHKSDWGSERCPQRCIVVRSGGRVS